MHDTSISVHHIWYVCNTLLVRLKSSKLKKQLHYLNRLGMTTHSLCLWKMNILMW